MSAPTIEKLPNGDVKVTTADQHGNQIGNTMTEKQAATFAYELLTKGLPNAGITLNLLGKTQ